jgi:hypothetical protein
LTTALPNWSTSDAKSGTAVALGVGVALATAWGDDALRGVVAPCEVLGEQPARNAVNATVANETVAQRLIAINASFFLASRNRLTL